MAEESNKIDYSFIAAREGTRNVGYVPYCTSKSTFNNESWCFKKEEGTAIQRSGVTIGTGLDLGQMNKYDLKKLKLSQGLHNKLKPYLLLIKKDAQDALNKNPLVLSGSEIAEINAAVKRSKFNTIYDRYNSAAKTSFISLPSEAQTAISSYLFQKGEYTDNEVWEAFVNQDWKKASDLMKAEKNDHNRRLLEASLLDNL